MSIHKPGGESEGAKSRDHEHPRHHLWRPARTNWLLWFGVVVMLAMMGVYIVTDNLSLRPGKPATQPTPEANVP